MLVWKFDEWECNHLSDDIGMARGPRSKQNCTRFICSILWTQIEEFAINCNDTFSNKYIFNLVSNTYLWGIFHRKRELLDETCYEYLNDIINYK